MRGRGAGLAALAAAALAGPASASGATIAVEHDCYVETTPTAPSAVTADGTGYTPNSTATVTLGGVTASVATDVNGNFTTSIAAPSTTLAHPGAQQVTLTATDDTTAAAVTTVVNLVKTGVDGVPHQSKPHKRITWYLAGFPGTKPVYGHWRIRSKTRADHRMGVPQGPCGVLRVKARQIEARHVLFGLWTVQFDFNRHYDKTATPRATVKINVFKTFS